MPHVRTDSIAETGSMISDSPLPLNEQLYHFPLSIPDCLPLLSDLARRDEKSCAHVVSLLERLPVFAEAVDETDRAELADAGTNHDGTYRTLVDRKPYGAHDPDDSVVIPSNTLGLLHIPPNNRCYVQWRHEYSGWQVALLELNRALIDVQQRRTLTDCKERAVAILDLVTAVMETDASMSGRLAPFLTVAVLLLKRLVCVADPPVALISAALRLCAALSLSDFSDFSPLLLSSKVFNSDTVSGGGILGSYVAASLADLVMQSARHEALEDFDELHDLSHQYLRVVALSHQSGAALKKPTLWDCAASTAQIFQHLLSLLDGLEEYESEEGEGLRNTVVLCVTTLLLHVPHARCEQLTSVESLLLQNIPLITSLTTNAKEFYHLAEKYLTLLHRILAVRKSAPSAFQNVLAHIAVLAIRISTVEIQTQSLECLRCISSSCPKLIVSCLGAAQAQELAAELSKLFTADADLQLPILHLLNATARFQPALCNMILQTGSLETIWSCLTDEKVDHDLHWHKAVYELLSQLRSFGYSALISKLKQHDDYYSTVVLPLSVPTEQLQSELVRPALQLLSLEMNGSLEQAPTTSTQQSGILKTKETDTATLKIVEQFCEMDKENTAVLIGVLRHVSERPDDFATCEAFVRVVQTVLRASTADSQSQRGKISLSPEYRRVFLFDYCNVFLPPLFKHANHELLGRALDCFVALYTAWEADMKDQWADFSKSLGFLTSSLTSKDFVEQVTSPHPLIQLAMLCSRMCRNSENEAVQDILQSSIGQLCRVIDGLAIADGTHSLQRQDVFVCLASFAAALKDVIAAISPLDCGKTWLEAVRSNSTLRTVVSVLENVNWKQASFAQLKLLSVSASLFIELCDHPSDMLPLIKSSRLHLFLSSRLQSLLEDDPFSADNVQLFSQCALLYATIATQSKQRFLNEMVEFVATYQNYICQLITLPVANNWTYHELWQKACVPCLCVLSHVMQYQSVWQRNLLSPTIKTAILRSVCECSLQAIEVFVAPPPADAKNPMSRHDLQVLKRRAVDILIVCLQLLRDQSPSVADIWSKLDYDCSSVEPLLSVGGPEGYISFEVMLNALNTFLSSLKKLDSHHRTSPHRNPLSQTAFKTFNGARNAISVVVELSLDLIVSQSLLWYRNLDEDGRSLLKREVFTELHSLTSRLLRASSSSMSASASRSRSRAVSGRQSRVSTSHGLSPAFVRSIEIDADYIHTVAEIVTQLL